MSDNSNKGSFWPSYVDIMTTLFAIMLVLFVVSYSRFKVKEEELQVLADHFIEIMDIYDAAIQHIEELTAKGLPVEGRCDGRVRIL